MRIHSSKQISPTTRLIMPTAKMGLGQGRVDESMARLPKKSPVLPMREATVPLSVSSCDIMSTVPTGLPELPQNDTGRKSRAKKKGSSG